MTYERFDPIFDRILIRREKSALERRVEKSGIHLTDKTKEGTKSSEGFLLKCGEDCEERIFDMIGKRILFAKYSGDDIKIGEEEYVLATQGDIFGVLRDE